MEEQEKGGYDSEEGKEDSLDSEVVHNCTCKYHKVQRLQIRNVKYPNW